MNKLKSQAGIYPLNYQLYDNNHWQEVHGAVTEEILLCIHVNGKELATFMCTPHEQDELALGFLRSEGIIHNMDEVRVLTISENGTCVDIWLDRSDFEPPSRRIITSGCGGGVTFDDMTSRQEPLNTSTSITPEQIFERMHDLYQACKLYQATQGIHTSALTDGKQLLLLAEDVGRHNTIDRLWGKAMKQNLPTKGLILLATGRISSEMLAKAAKMEVPIIASRTSPTSMSIALAQAWNITVIGYVRRNSLRVYTSPQRVSGDGVGSG